LSQTDPAFARKWLWASNIGNLWTLVIFGSALWLASGRSWTSLGLSAPDGWRLWTSGVLVLLVAGYQVYGVATLARSSEARAGFRKQFGPVAAVMPHTRSEMYWFGGVSLTAGFCEEFLYRGYFIFAFTPVLGWWGAAALSLAVFAGGHAYQGWIGVLKTGITGAVFTVSVAVFDSLWPAIALHAIVDLGAGLMSWVTLREGTEPQSTSGVTAPSSQELKPTKPGSLV
jgi:membrane protease YdiL (CAAX protease family)